jgi:hypothetical protein
MGRPMMPPIPRPDSYPDPGEPLLEASRYVNALAEEHGLEECVRRLGLDMTVLTHVADQRALVNVLVQSGRHEELSRVGLQVFGIKLDQLERAAVLVFTAAYMDGIAIGYQARVLEERANTSTPGGDV